MALRGRPSFQQVLPGLFIGSRISLYLPGTLSQAGITSLLAVNGWTKFPPGFRTLSIDARDDVDEPLFHHFKEAVQFIRESHGGTLVFCDAGISRSATIVAAYLIAEKGMGRKDAVATIKAVRNVQPNRGFVKQLDEFARKQHCDLCALEKRTRWFEETRDFVILECEQCNCPIAVYRNHQVTAPAAVAAAMLKALSKHAGVVFNGTDFVIDKHMRTVPGHCHFHARPPQRYKL